MSKKRKRVEIESDLSKSESDNNGQNEVEDPDRIHTSHTNSINDSDDTDENSQENGGQTDSLGNSSYSDNKKNLKKPQNNENENPKNNVFTGSADSAPTNKVTDTNNIKSDNGQPSKKANSDEKDNNEDNKEKLQDNNSDKTNNNSSKTPDKNSESSETSNKNDKSSNKPNNKDSKSKVTDTDDSNKTTGNKVKQVASEKLGDHSDTLDKLNKLRNFKDIKNMSKEEAKQEVVEIGKDIAKKKAIALFMTYVAPYLIPILLGIFVVILIIIVIISAISGSGDKHSTKKQGCKTVNENSENITSSKDAIKNAEKIYEYEMKHADGAKPKGVAAHLGNIDVESAHTFDPKIIQNHGTYKEDIAKDETVSGYAFGIAQWDGVRRVNLIKYAKSKSKKWDDFSTQLDFLLNHDGTDSDTIKKLLKSDDSIGTITENIMNDWERAGDKGSISQRKAAASKFYAKFSKKDVGSGEGNIDDATDAASDNSDASENSGCNTTEDTGGKGEIGESVKANGKSGEIKEKWGSKKEIPEKYKKHIKIPDFKEKILDSPENIFPTTGDKGQCTELTWGYIKQLYGTTPPSNGNGNVIYKAYEAKGAKITANPTVGYGFSSDPPYAGAEDASVGHTGIVAGVMDNGDWIMANYNLNGEGNNGQQRVLTYALVDGNKKSGGIKFFSGIGKPKVKSKD